MIDIIWKDRVLKNPRKIKLKEIDSEKILDYEIQDDPENIIEDSDTPINATTLNIMVGAINGQLSEYNNWIVQKNNEFKSMLDSKSSEMSVWQNDFETKWENKLSTLGTNIVEVIAVEEYTVK